MKRIINLLKISIVVLFYTSPYVLANAQSNKKSSYAYHVIEGQIYDQQNVFIPGASVRLKTADKTVAISDINGKFSLPVEQDLPVTLVFDFLGFVSKEVLVDDSRKPLKISLDEDVKELNEVVVTAFGISRKKKSLGYSTQEVKGDDLSRNGETNLINSLSGKIAGVRTTNSQGDMGSSRIVIRGETSIAGNNQALFIVNGVPVDNSQLNSGGATRDFRNAIADLNPEDIESISVLKGPNAAALYGSRAAHGVILITSKSGKGQKGLGISVSSGISFAKVTTLPKFQNEFGQGANGLFSYVDGKGGGINDGVDESWGPKMDGRLIPQFHSNGEPVPFVAHANNVNDFFKTGVTYDNAISIAGADTKYDFRLGINNQKQQGTVPNTEINKTNFTISTNYQINPNIKVGTNANYILTDAPNLPGGPSGGRAAGVMLQFLWFGRQVDTYELKNERDVNWNNSYYSNPYWNTYYNTVTQKRNRLIGDVHLDIKILEGLDFKLIVGTDYYNDRRKYRIKYGTNGTPFGSYAEDAYTVFENNTESILRYTKQLNKDFRIDALGGFNVRNRSYENNYQKAPRLAVPDLYTLTNSRDPLTSSNYLSKLKVFGAYASAQLAYKNFAYLNLTARNDWSSTLPTSNRSYFYPSVNASLVVSDALKINSNVLDFLKVRGGWSEVGNDAEPYQLASVYNSQTAFSGNPIQTSSQKKLNSDLRPEITRSTEFGGELSLLKRKIHLDVAFYNTNSIDQILEIKTSAASGYTSQVLNAGKINNKGLEIQLNIVPLELKKFKWDLGLNYAKNTSEVQVLDYDGNIENYVIGSSGGVDVLASVGKKYGALYGTAYLRDGGGNIIVGSNGLPRADTEKKILGYYTPSWTGGLSNTFTYKSIYLGFLIDASIGGEVYSGTNRTGTYTGVLQETLYGRDTENGGLSYIGSDGVLRHDGMVFHGVKEDGTINQTIVSAQQYYKGSYNINEAYIYSASYIKFREIRLGYSFDKKLLQKFGLGAANIALVGRNLFFIYKKAPNIDPETAFNTGNAQGLESLSLPTTRTFGVNLNLKF